MDKSVSFPLSSEYETSDGQTDFSDGEQAECIPPLPPHNRYGVKNKDHNAAQPATSGTYNQRGRFFLGKQQQKNQTGGATIQDINRMTTGKRNK